MSVYKLIEEEREEFRTHISDLEHRNNELREELNKSHNAYKRLQDINTGMDKLWVNCINANRLTETELNELNQKLSSAGINIKLKFRDEKNTIKQLVDLLIETKGEHIGEHGNG
jgi:ribosomal protein L20